MEIVTTIAVIMILTALIIPAYTDVRSRIEKVNCTNNLHQLYVAGSGYLQQNGHWPQVDPALQKNPNHAYDEAWIEALMPFGASRQLWICPTIQHALGGPDYMQPKNYRADYSAMPFDAKAISPNRWATQPWFAERGNVHGNGNLLILANGTVTDLNTVRTMGSGN